ncbi:hypothetical protein C2845_PM13G21060 [Panicum miliaceum]|uniref:Uncharacterized protein n=1 Tax=Panicum miliaceum TaxID=4540 RepID=A0A3L6RG26_PANMI|nr:hypothetical protein C2845_PM13G21060 [Panicum miliaceum]
MSLLRRLQTRSRRCIRLNRQQLLLLHPRRMRLRLRTVRVPSALRATTHHTRLCALQATTHRAPAPCALGTPNVPRNTRNCQEITNVRMPEKMNTKILLLLMRILKNNICYIGGHPTRAVACDGTPGGARCGRPTGPRPGAGRREHDGDGDDGPRRGCRAATAAHDDTHHGEDSPADLLRRHGTKGMKTRSASRELAPARPSEGAPARPRCRLVPGGAAARRVHADVAALLPHPASPTTPTPLRRPGPVVPAHLLLLLGTSATTGAPPVRAPTSRPPTAEPADPHPLCLCKCPSEAEVSCEPSI